MKKNKVILVTGSAGFIGYHLCNKLLSQNFIVIGLDNLSNYYDRNLKISRNKILKKNKNYIFHKLDINNFKNLKNKTLKYKPEIIIHLAAQAGVRYSLINPKSYIDNNINGFFNILEISKLLKIKHLLYASSSSVYGINEKFPFKESLDTSFPSSLYGATKKINEVLAFSYSYNFKIPTTGLRFFTVYGPFGRPDMSLYKFVSGVLNKKKIDLFNKGKHTRDFTYIDDLVESVFKLINKYPKKINYKVNFKGIAVPYNIFNICSSNPIKLKKYIEIIEKFSEKKSKKRYLEIQKGDVEITSGDNSQLKSKINKKKFTKVEQGIKNYISWYKSYYGK